MDALRTASEAAHNSGYETRRSHTALEGVEVMIRPVVPASDGRRSPGYGASLDFAQAAPNSVGLADPERVTEALLAHRASGAHRLGLPLARRSRFFAFEVRGREKDGRRLASASRSSLPALRCIQRCHSVSSMPKVLLSREL